MGVEVLVPIAVFGFTALVFWIIFNASAKKRRAALETIQAIVEKTGEVTPELIQAIGRPQRVKNADLRKGLILIAIAIAFALLGQMVPADEAAGPMMGVALFPGLVGIVFVMFHFMGGKDDDQAA